MRPPGMDPGQQKSMAQQDLETQKLEVVPVSDGSHVRAAGYAARAAAAAVEAATAVAQPRALNMTDWKAPRTTFRVRSSGATTASERGSMLSQVQAEVGHIEARINSRLAHAREGSTAALHQVESLHNAAFHHLEKKLSALDAAQQTTSRKLQELTGVVTGLKDEIQVQLRQSDGLDVQIDEIRHSVESSMQRAQTELSFQIQALASSARVAEAKQEEVACAHSERLEHLDQLVQETLAHQEESGLAIVGLRSRIGTIEDEHERAQTRQKVGDLDRAHGESTATLHSDARIWQLEQHSMDLAKQLRNLKDEAHGDSGWDLRLAEIETRLSGLRAKIDSQETHNSKINECIRQEMETRFDRLWSSIHQAAGVHLGSNERLEALVNWAEGVEHSLAAMHAGRQVAIQAESALHEQDASDATRAPASVEKDDFHQQVLYLETQIGSKDEAMKAMARLDGERSMDGLAHQLAGQDVSWNQVEDAQAFRDWWENLGKQHINELHQAMVGITAKVESHEVALAELQHLSSVPLVGDELKPIAIGTHDDFREEGGSSVRTISSAPTCERPEFADSGCRRERTDG